METGRNVMHYALGDNQDYEHEWSKAVLEYLENGYSSEDSKSEVEVGNTTYKILKREKVTAFYDADGNTLFDIENDRLKEEYEAMDFRHPSRSRKWERLFQTSNSRHLSRRLMMI